MENITKYVADRIKMYRERRNITQQELAEAINTTQQSIARYESGERKADQNILFALAEYFQISINDFFPKLKFENAELVDISSDSVKIPVLGIIKAGIAIEAQQDIFGYVEIPKSWTLGGKQFYGLKISGDSMYPKYHEDDIVIFEKSDDMSSANNKDCAVMVNGDDATFKKVLINENGIVLVPYNSAAYDMVMYSKEDIENKPIRIIGIAKEKRTKIN